MLDIGWMEMAVIAFVALIVIGPKDLPKAMRGVAKWVRKARALSREFQSGLDEMMREAELDEAKKSIESVRRYRVDKLVEEEVDPTGSVSRELKEIDDEARDRRTPTAKPAAASAPDEAPTDRGDETGPAEPVRELEKKPAEAQAAATKPAATKPAATKPAATKPAAKKPAAKRPGEAEPAEPKKGRVVSHPAKMAPGNSVKPPAVASETPETPAEASEPPPPAKTSSSGGAAD